LTALSTSRTQPGEQTASTCLNSISVTDFRNYGECRLETGAPRVLLLGPNGAGKTNLMEAVSLLAPGRGLRRAKPEDLGRIGVSGGAWAVWSKVLARGREFAIGTGVPAGDAA